MASEIVRQGQAAWRRLKRSSKSWDGWKAVGHALLEGRAIAMRKAGTTSPSGGGYSGAFNDWLTYHRFEMSPSDRAKLLVVMEILPAVEAWRASLKIAAGATQQPGLDVTPLPEGDWDHACSGARQPSATASVSVSVTITKATAAESDMSHIWSHYNSGNCHPDQAST